MLAHGQDVLTGRERPLPIAGDGALVPQGVWDTGTLAWVKMTQPGGGGGGGGAVTEADGANIALGATTDAAVTSNAAGTVSAKLRGIVAILANVWDSVNGRVRVDGSGVTQPVSGPLTDAQLRAVAVPVSGTFWQATQPVSGPLTDAQLRAVAVPVSGPLTDAQLRAVAVPVSGPLTDAQLRAVAVPVSGTFWQATQPVSGPLTDAQLRASAVPVTANAGTNLNTSALNLETTQSAINAKLPSLISGRLPVQMKAVPTFVGRASTFRTPGRAGTTGQKILSLHNATGSVVAVKVTKVIVDFTCTVVKAVTVLPPIVRLWKVTVLPTNGTALTKNKIGGSGASSGSITVLGDASADGTGSGTTLTATLPAGTIVTQEFAPRMITAAGYEMADRMEFLDNSEVNLGALEGVVVFLDYTLATQNPTTDMWVAGIEWEEA